jgi:DNA topoisomerase-1
MAAAKTHVRTATLTIDGVDPVWNAEQTKPSFEGWRAVEQTEKSKETAVAEEAAWTAWTPLLAAGSVLTWTAITADEVFTKPPGRYTEATLIRELERRGIGRPSTFASLVTTLFEREYVEKTNIEGKPYETRHLTRKPGAIALKETVETHKSGAEKNKVRATPLGVSVTECLQRDFQDLFAYEFTAQMEGGLDSVSNGAKEWKSVLQETWDTYKDRYSAALAEKGEARTQTVGGSGEGEGVKVIQTKRGPLLVRPKADGSGDEFAPLPPGVTAANAATKLTPALINEAFEAAAAAKNGEVIGIWEEQEMLKKKGPFGFYVQCGDLKVPFKAEDTEETLRAKLDAKKSAYERKVGPYVIKQGPYGLYFMKMATAVAPAKAEKGKGKTAKAAPAAKAPKAVPKGGKPRFVSFPKDKDPDAATEKELDELYDAPPVKKTYVRKPKAGVEKN